MSVFVPFCPYFIGVFLDNIRYIGARAMSQLLQERVPGGFFLSPHFFAALALLRSDSFMYLLSIYRAACKSLTSIPRMLRCNSGWALLIKNRRWKT